MACSLRIKESAAKALQRIHKADRIRLVEAIDRLRNTPTAGGVLKGEFSGLRRLRVGRYPDHIHVYADTDGELSVDAIVKRIKGSTEKAIQREFTGMLQAAGVNTGLWGEAYFAETVG